MHAWMDVHIYKCMYVCTHKCSYTCLPTHTPPTNVHEYLPTCTISACSLQIYVNYCSFFRSAARYLTVPYEGSRCAVLNS